MIANTNTIINPGTVMIESLNTLMTDSTVSASNCPEDLTLRAQLSSIEIFH